MKYNLELEQGEKLFQMNQGSKKQENGQKVNT